MSFVLGIEEYNQYRNEFTPVNSVDKSIGANIGAVWRELLAKNDEDVFKVSGFVARGSNIYALVSSSYEDSFNLISWVSKKLSFEPKVAITPFNYSLIFGEGKLPRSIDEVLEEIRSVRSASPVSVPNCIGGSDSYDDEFGATTVLSEDYINISGGEFSFDIFDEGEEYSIGRGSEASLRVVARGVSRSHLRVRYREGEFQIYDLGSTNGTRVNGVRVPTETWFTVSDGSTIKIGKVALKVRKMEEM
jgi:putative FHA domain protein